ncbi:hypothetical protein [Corallococcus sicarius]|uniref:hypothetical protein n=1 Tax=Corallococcus sicarius TaxID=2316726 RepID=UPI001FC9B6B3|nr:hypothetical protein [Corallococcus sicarius]
MNEVGPLMQGVHPSVRGAEPAPPPRNAQAQAVALPAQEAFPEAFPESFPEAFPEEPVTQPEGQPHARRWAARASRGERWIARMLRTGAVMSGGMFVASLALELLPRDESVHVAIDLLRKGAASMLLVTPVARLAMAGTLLGLRGEWRYTAIAAGVLGLLALAVGAGFQA